MRSTHSVFKKRSGVPSLNFHGSMSSYNAGSMGHTPEKKRPENSNFNELQQSPEPEFSSQIDFRGGDNNSVV